jgi:Putative Ig domain
MSLLFSSIVKGCFAWVLILVFAPSLARAQLFTLSSITGWWDYDSAAIREVDPATGATISFKWIILPPGTYGTYTTGLAAHPTTGEFFALVESAPSPTGPICQHKLAKIDPATGAATILGNTGACFASLAFHSNGTLYGVTNSEGTEPSSLFTLDTTSATPTFLISFDTVGVSSGAVVGGSGLAFNPSDGLLYRSGRVNVSDQIFFQAIDPGTLAVTDIPLSGSPTDEIIALTHSFENTLLGADVSNRLFSITTEGVRTLIGPMDHLARGLVFATYGTPPPPPLTIGATTLATGEAGVPFTSDLMISGGVTPYIVSITKGALPAGLSLGNDGIISGTISPTAKSAKITVRITDSINESLTQTFAITVIKALHISERARTGRVGKDYAASFKIRGGLGPFNWSITSGVLPTGLNFNTTTGAITGIPTQAGSFPLSVQVTDALGGVAVETLPLTIK